jgi:alkylation response protein AidB-like acyl-CoA dehydrogenase
LVDQPFEREHTMLVALEPDQEFFRDTTARFLAETVPVEELRRLHTDEVGFDATYWRRGAELGWTLLLVGEEHGGGSISGNGLVDLTLVADQFGRTAAPGPLLVTSIVASALSAAGGAHPDVLAGLIDGSTIATWGYAERRPHQRYGDVVTTIEQDGDDLVVTGIKRPVESANRSSHVLVTGRTGDRLSQVLVPIDAPGVSVREMQTVDLTRRFSEVRFDGVRLGSDALVGDLAGADEQVGRQALAAVVVSAAEMVGAMQFAFDMTLEYSFQRYSFGRPLSSYQALKHRFADMKMSLEASHAIADVAAAAVSAGDPEAGEIASAAKAFVGERGNELMQECVQLHGGIGVTYEHDLHLYLRRQSLDRTLYGTPSDHRQRIAVLAQEREAA